MRMNRRGFLGSILAAAAAPAIVRAGTLMSVRTIVIPRISAIKGEILFRTGDPFIGAIDTRMVLTREMIAYGILKAGEKTILIPDTKNPGDTLTFRRWVPYDAMVGITSEDII